MDKVKAIEKLQRQIEPIDRLKRLASHGQEFKKWHRDTEIAKETGSNLYS